MQRGGGSAPSSWPSAAPSAWPRVETTRTPTQRRRGGGRPRRPTPTSRRSRTSCSSTRRRSTSDTAQLREGAEEYYALAEAADFDYARAARGQARRGRSVRRAGAGGLRRGQPGLRGDGGRRGRRPVARRLRRDHRRRRRRLAIPRTPCRSTLETPAGKTYEQPGNFNYLIETSAFGTEPKFAAKGVEPDLDGDGKVEFGEALPDADFYVTAAREFEKTTRRARRRRAGVDADGAGRVHRARRHDARRCRSTSRRGRTRASSPATRRRRRRSSPPRACRTSPTSSAACRPSTRASSRASRGSTTRRRRRPKQDLDELTAFAERLRDEEAGGKKFTAEEADTLGGEAQTRAEAIAGQISQAAGQLDIQLET